MEKFKIDAKKLMKYAKHQLIPHLKKEEFNIGDIELLFTVHQQKKGSDLQKKDSVTNLSSRNLAIKSSLLDSSHFDYHKYNVVSPFVRPRDLTPPPQHNKQKLSFQESEYQRHRINSILRSCSNFHNSLANLCQKEGTSL